MIKRIGLFIIAINLSSCNLSFKNDIKYQSRCLYYFHLENELEIVFIKNKEFRKISNFLKTMFGAKSIRKIVYFKTKEVYYCEYYENDYTIHCLILDKNLKIISKKKILFDI